eukprot:CAMPEP_0119377096 /NCGR_PEP_ID=MMETSP1334-20130426/43193_1 /TAXON_ID=127549 /ORGANISM="Calcidiscus leptoporus, Strain RCC1130" /LENGTH=694 /DNA_ID=CAMNT_0007395887 /DNA_START=232 /DNA_END=2316 /DNA_ORIENTATION=-
MLHANEDEGEEVVVERRPLIESKERGERARAREAKRPARSVLVCIGAVLLLGLLSALFLPQKEPLGLQPSQTHRRDSAKARAHRRATRTMPAATSAVPAARRTRITPADSSAVTAVRRRMRYWAPPRLVQPSAHSEHYLTFDVDCGGFNNIRMAFEYAVLLAFLTRRTLVLPPPQPWYLIDFGPFARMVPTADSARHSTYDIFFDMRALSAAVPFITTDEFLRREGKLLQRLGGKQGEDGEDGEDGEGGEDGKDGRYTELRAPHNVTWQGAQQLCAAARSGDGIEGRLCAFDEVCPLLTSSREINGTASEERRGGLQRSPRNWRGGKLHGDHWVPIQSADDSERDWVEVGDSRGRQCLRHRALGLPPPWENATVRLKGVVLCCGGVPSIASGRSPSIDLRDRAGQVRYMALLAEPARTLMWEPLKKYIAWPSIAHVNEAADDPDVRRRIGRRQPVEYSPFQRAQRLLNLPSCRLPRKPRYRFLGQVASVVVTAPRTDRGMDASIKQLLRDHVRYNDVIWDIASRVVAALRPFGYSSLHIRRNDLQYKQVFIAAQRTLKNVRPLLEEAEPLYIATDETSASFFDAIREHHPVFQWKDFFEARGGFVLRNVSVPRKLIGCIEQAICAMGRVFVGTKLSTFSSYITRLRGYIGAPDTLTYFHTQSANLNRSENERAQPFVTGTNYLVEDPRVWEDTK